MKKESKSLFKCTERGLLYDKKEIAERCRKWCAEYKSCNMQIIKYAKNKYKK